MNEPGSRIEHTGRGTAGPAGPRAVITISHQHGSRGAAVARLVSERLGFSFWDRELVSAVASQLRVDPSAMTPFDEHPHGALAPSEGAQARTSALAELGPEDYVRGLKLVAHTIARRGSAVVVGRGLGFLIDPASCLRVRVVCPLEQRVAGLAERAQLCPETARATIEFVDRERQAFIRELHGCDIDDATHYDLTLSTGLLTVAGAAELIASAYHARFEQRRWPTPATSPNLRRGASRTTTGERGATAARGR